MCAWETNGGGEERGVSRGRGRSGWCARRFEPRGRSGGAKNFFERATDRSPRRPTAHVAVFFSRRASSRSATAVRRAAARGNKPQVGAWRGRCGRDRPPGAVGARARGSARGRDVFLVARRARDRRGGIATRRGGRAERRGQGSPSDATGRGSGASGGRIRARDPEVIRNPARRTRRGDGIAGRPRRRARGRGAPRAARTGSARRARGGRGEEHSRRRRGPKTQAGSLRTRVRVRRRPARGSRRRDARDEPRARTKRSAATGGSGGAPECPSRARRQRRSRCRENEPPTSDRAGRTAETLPAVTPGVGRAVRARASPTRRVGSAVARRKGRSRRSACVVRASCVRAAKLLLPPRWRGQPVGISSQRVAVDQRDNASLWIRAVMVLAYSYEPRWCQWDGARPCVSHAVSPPRVARAVSPACVASSRWHPSRPTSRWRR